MSFAAPMLLGLLAALPLLWLLARHALRRRTLTVPTTLIWARVAARLPAAVKQRRKLDAVLVLLMCGVALAVLAAALPLRVTAGGSPPKPRVLVDTSAAMLLEAQSGGSTVPREWLAANGAVLPRGAPLSGGAFDAGTVSSWVLGQPRDGAPLIVVSPRNLDLGGLGVTQVSLAPRADSLPFERLSIEGEWLFARTTSVGQSWVLEDAESGRELSSAVAQGSSLLLRLPDAPLRESSVSATPHGLLLRRSRGGRTFRDAAFVAELPKPRVEVRGMERRTVEALQAAFGSGVVVGESFSTTDAAPMFRVIADGKDDGGATASLIVAQAEAIAAEATGNPEATLSFAAGVNFQKELPAGWLRPELITHALPANSGAPLLTLRLPDGRDWPLISRSSNPPRLHTSLDLAERLPRESWFPSLLSGLCESLTQCPLIDTPQYTLSDPPAWAAALLPTSTATPQTAPGLYVGRAVNALAPPADALIARDLLPELPEAPDASATEYFQHYPGLASVLLFAAALVLLLLRVRRAPAVSST